MSTRSKKNKKEETTEAESGKKKEKKEEKKKEEPEQKKAKEVEEEHKGKCFCGAIKFTCHGKPMSTSLCSCSICCRFNGADRCLFASFSWPKFEVTEGQSLVSSYRTSPMGQRMFCSKCGTRLWCEIGSDKDSMHMMCLYPGLFAADDKYKIPEEWIPKQQSYCLNSVLPASFKESDVIHYKDMPKEWHGTGETM
eukprot:TRINITY_DN7687_c0_g1_i1.p1 TRINITY_DN7687_c0_g1~~TRINITY_DN7687_c0_g1_i1.p1  ORF type:complete len:195 (-),score=39.56 TRINITY_DN7687_c0_g1_i1:202-786(-)